MDIKNKLIKVIKIFLITCFFVCIIELCIRIEDSIKWGAPFWGYYAYDVLLVVDSLGYHNKPYSKFEKWQINSAGFRGPEIAINKPDSVIRVAILGASETFGLYESPDNDYPAQLQAIFDSEQPGRYQVLNAASPGMSPPRIIFYYNFWIRNFKPDIAIIYPTPVFYLNRNVPQPGVTIPTHKKTLPVFSFRLPTKLKIVMKQFIPGSIQKIFKQYMIKRAVRNHDENWVFEEVPNERITIFREQTEELLEILRRDNVLVIIGTHAVRISDEMTKDDHDDIVNWRYMYPNIAENTFLKMEAVANETIQNLGKEDSVYIVDINSIIPKTREFFADHQHFTDKGANLVARAFADKIISITSQTDSYKR